MRWSKIKKQCDCSVCVMREGVADDDQVRDRMSQRHLHGEHALIPQTCLLSFHVVERNTVFALWWLIGAVAPTESGQTRLQLETKCRWHQKIRTFRQLNITKWLMTGRSDRITIYEGGSGSVSITEGWRRGRWGENNWTWLRRLWRLWRPTLVEIERKRGVEYERWKPSISSRVNIHLLRELLEVNSR